jgi:uncharacterized protein (TIGR02284 family)
METQTNETDVKRLNSLLRGELSAVETYDQCIEKIDDGPITQQLQTLKSSHSMRVQKLASRIRQLGGTPDQSSGAWGSFAKLVEGGAKVFGEKAAIAALEEGEDHGNEEYEEIEDLTPGTRQFVEAELVPEQQRTHDVLSQLKRAI